MSYCKVGSPVTVLPRVQRCTRCNELKEASGTRRSPVHTYGIGLSVEGSGILLWPSSYRAGRQARAQQQLEGVCEALPNARCPAREAGVRHDTADTHRP